MVTTGAAGRVEGYGEGLDGTAYQGSGLVNLYTWFQWGTTTAYGNTSPQVVNPQNGGMSYIITSTLQPNTVYHYQAVGSNSYGVSYGADATFVSAGPPTINTQPRSQAVAVGATVTFTVGASASDGVLFYQWEKNGGDIASATSSSLTISNAQYSDAGTYTVAVASDWGGEEPVDSSPALLNVGSGPPTITSQPTNQTVVVGTNVSFTASVIGQAPFSYQWFFDGTNIAGATDSVLTLTNVQPSNAGTYYFTATNAPGSATSSNATLTVNVILPLILTQPSNQTVNVGATASFSVTAAGSSPLSYQWQFNGTNLLNATNSSLSLDNAQVYEDGAYSVTVTNAFGSATSSNATLTVNVIAPSILTQPTNQSVYVGQTAIFSITAAGTPLSYQWQVNGTNLNGATNAMLTLNNVTPGQAGTYDVVVSNSAGLVQSSNATLIVMAAPPCDPPPPGIISWWRAEGNPVDWAGGKNGALNGSVSYGPGMVGQAFVFSAANSAVLIGSPTSLQLQNFTFEAWIQRSSSSVVSLNGSGTDAEMLSYGSGGYVFGMNGSGNIYLSQVGTSNVQGPAVTDTSWHHVAVTKTGTTVVFYVDGVASPAAAFGVTFSFESNLAIGGSGDNFGSSFYGAIDELAVYDRALSATELQGIFNAGASGKCPASPPVIASQPVSETVAIGGHAVLSIVVAGQPPFTYQWVLNGTNVNGATNNSLTLSPVQPDQAGDYFVVVSNINGTLQSSNATLTTLPAPPCDPPPSGLVSWWKGEDNALDSAGTNNGTLTGSVSYGPGTVGQAFVFSAFSMQCGVKLGNPASLQLQDFTIESWIKRGSTSAFSFSGSDGNLFSYGTYGYGFGFHSDGTLFLTEVGGSQVSVPSGITDTNWHHVAVSKTGTNVVFYVDGVAYPAPAYNVSFLFIFNLAVGSRGDNLASSFYGSIDELSVYNRALSGTEIQTIFNTGASGKCLIAAQPTAPVLGHLAYNAPTGSLGFSFTNVPGAHFSVYGTTNLVSTNWILLGTAAENPQGSYSSYSFSETNAFTNMQRFYRVTSP